jgi:hypothetical protein
MKTDKKNWGQIAAIFTIIALLLGWVFSAGQASGRYKDHEKRLIQIEGKMFKIDVLDTKMDMLLNHFKLNYRDTSVYLKNNRKIQ